MDGHTTRATAPHPNGLVSKIAGARDDGPRSAEKNRRASNAVTSRGKRRHPNTTMAAYVWTALPIASQAHGPGRQTQITSRCRWGRDERESRPGSKHFFFREPFGSVRDARHIFSIEKILKAAKSCSNHGAVADARLYFDSITLATIKV